MKRIFTFLLAIVMVLGLTMQADATLFLRGTDTTSGNQLIYDSDLDITWYDYTNAYNIWQNQVNWADALTVNFGGTTYDNWRLPTGLNADGSGPCTGWNCTGSEMGHLYYTELGNIAKPGGGPLSTDFTDGLTGETESFLNLQIYGYWSGTESTDPDFTDAYKFNFYNGVSLVSYKGSTSQALAVLPGDVAAVPEPATVLLLGCGLAGLGLLRRRFKS